jgi:hypothetical protein
MPLPPSNCKTPDHAKTCHFWGDPHFTHLFKSNNKGNKDAKKGGRQRQHKKLFNFNPSGVYQLATSADGSFEAQVFFCPYISKTTTGAGLALRIGDDLIHMVRGEATAPQSTKKNYKRGDNQYWAVLDKNAKGPEANFTEFFVNGQRKSWEELGDATGTRGKHVQGNGGTTTGSSFLRQLKTNRESGGSMLPVCAGDGEHNLVEVSAPHLKGSHRWPSVYEQAVTIRSNNPGDSGICSATDDKKFWRKKSNGEQFKVDAKKNLFSTRQMKSLCDMCRLSMHDGVCGAPSHDVSAKEVCEGAGEDYNAAKAECINEFGEDSDWFDVCVMETCATGDGAVAISRIEEHLQEQLIAEEE